LGGGGLAGTRRARAGGAAHGGAAGGMVPGDAGGAGSAGGLCWEEASLPVAREVLEGGDDVGDEGEDEGLDEVVDGARVRCVGRDGGAQGGEVVGQGGAR
jgi:hypothetical protein